MARNTNPIHLLIICVCAGFIISYPPLFARAGDFKFAWLSDTHVGSSTGADDLRRSIADINAMRDVAFAIISGDVTEFGSDLQLHEAKHLLDSLTKPYYIIPGNHDTKWSESGCTTFPRLFGSDKFIFEFAGIRFIGLHQGPRMRMGDGHWAPEDMRWLDSVLTTIPSKQQPLIFVTHYPVDSSISNWYIMLEKVRKFNTQAILHGHGHQNMAVSFEGIPGIMSRSNLRGSEPYGGFTIVELRNDSLLFTERTPGIRTQSPWCQIPISARDYSRDTANYSRPDFSINSQYPGVKVKWKFSTNWTITSAPALTESLAIVGDASGMIHALGLKDAHVAWQFKAGGGILSSPAADKNIVVFTSTDGSIYCLDAASGRFNWKHKTDKPIVASPAIHDRLVLDNHNDVGIPEVYVGSSEGVFRKLDARSGRLIWEFRGIEGFVEARPLIGQKVVFGAWGGGLYALNRNDGKLEWQWRNLTPGVLFSPAACTPVESHNGIFFVAPDRMSTALDAESGRLLWRTAQFQVRESIGPSSLDNKFYVRTLRDSIVALSVYSQDPEICWVSNVGFGYDHNSAALVEKNGTLFYGTRNGLLIGLEARNGKVKWKYKTGATLLNTVAPVDDRRVVVSNTDGEVMLIESED